MENSLPTVEKPLSNPVPQVNQSSPQNPIPVPPQKNNRVVLGVVMILLILVAVGIFFVNKNDNGFNLFNNNPVIEEGKVTKTDKVELAKFKSDQEFVEYINSAQDSISNGYSGFGSLQTITGRGMEVSLAPGVGESADSKLVPGRVSETNVQVAGIDEPDIVKTNGNEIFYSTEKYLQYLQPDRGITSREADTVMPIEVSSTTKSISAFPPSSMKNLSEIKRSGNLILSDNTLIVLSDKWLYGYDVSDPEDPKEIWHYEMNDANYVTSRLFDNKLYLITVKYVDSYKNCPIPLLKSGAEIAIKCTDIYYPTNISISSDSIYTALIIDPKSGQVENKNSFVGDSGNTTTYMSNNAIYIANAHYPDTVEIMIDFFSENSDLFPEEFVKSLDKVKALDISSDAKMAELMVQMNKLELSMDQDQRLKLENEIANRGSDFAKKHYKRFEKLAVVKLSNKDLEIESTGDIPGTLVNQFAMDEYNENLRMAITLSGRNFIFNSNTESVNEVYVLNKDLDIIGNVTDLGLTERIYSARFIDDKGYVVTFRQIDPFYVIDLSDPYNPKKAGELKIPGYSSYLHPITDEKILGVGMENRQVKLSLFDVSDPYNPQEISKYNLDENWTEVNSNHHAFLMDDKHKVFFLPASDGGYIFSYEGDELKLVKAVSGINTERAIYINNFMYILSPEKITVLNENTWEEVNELAL